jgi:hypothetical protein
MAYPDDLQRDAVPSPDEQAASDAFARHAHAFTTAFVKTAVSEDVLRGVNRTYAGMTFDDPAGGEYAVGLRTLAETLDARGATPVTPLPASVFDGSWVEAYDQYVEPFGPTAENTVESLVEEYDHLDIDDADI